MEQVEQNEQIAGNIQTAIFTQGDNGYQAKKFFFTYHLKKGAEQNETFKDAFLRLEQLKELCDKFIWGEEYGKGGDTPHIQGGFLLKIKMRASTINTNFFLNNCYLTKLKNWNACVLYCSKECNEIHTNVKIPKPIKTLTEDQVNSTAWEKRILGLISHEPNERHIHWIVGDGAVGKTSFCKYLCLKHDAIMCGGKSADMKNCIVEYKKNNGVTPELILINLPRSFNKDYLSYTGIEEVKDMCFYSGKYEGGMVLGNCPHIFIFSNEYPDENKLSPDRWCIYTIGGG